jgi:polyvinyl alcohol dehydrogenase (cytochrome)
MRTQGYKLSGKERRAVATFLTGEEFESAFSTSAQSRCNSPAEAFTGKPGWNGWGNGVRNRSFQSGKRAGLTEERVSRLKLRWAFGFADSYSAWAQPVVAGKRVFLGSQAGMFYSLDAKTGCVHWSFEARAGVRGAASVGPRAEPLHQGSGKSGRFAVYFADLQGHAYALDAQSGELLWVSRLDAHERARVTGSPTLYGSRIYVPMSSWATVVEQGAECCTFRGSVSSVDVHTGKVIWKTYTIPTEARPLGEKSARGTVLWGPSGSAVWSAVTVDEERGLVYAGTGNSYTGQAVNSDSLVAFDMASGTIRWTKQLTPDDVWLQGCGGASTSDCNSSGGPNFDIASAPMLVIRSDGKDLLIVGQKSGMVYALDPDNNGQVVWTYRAGQGGIAGGILWGSAADSQTAYFPVSDLTRNQPGGLHAISLDTGLRVWYAPPSKLLCGVARYGCSQAQAVGLAVMPAVVFAGAADGGFRAYSTRSGKVLWEYDTNREFETVNGVKAKGGSLMGVGPTIVDGVVYVNSGYGTNGGRVGNVLLAFSPE